MHKFVPIEEFYKHFPKAADDKARQESAHFNIFKIEDILLPNKKEVSYSRRNFFKISLVEGHSKIHYADQTFEFNAPVLVFTNPMVPYHWDRISEKHMGYLCVFTSDFFSRFDDLSEYPAFQSAANAIVPLTLEQKTYFKSLFLRMSEELQSDYPHKYSLLRSLLAAFIHEGQKIQPAVGKIPARSTASQRIYDLFIQLLERQFPIELSSQTIQLKTPSDFAGQLNVHVNHLNKALKQHSGQTTTKLINARILQEAKVLLKASSWSIAEIAYSLGFEEQNHFSAFFKSKEKRSPGKFRKAD